MAVVKYKVLGMKQTSKALDGLTLPKFRKAALRKSGVVSMAPVLSALQSAAPTLKSTSILPKGSMPNALRNDLTMKKSVNVSPRVSKSGNVTKASRNELLVTITTGKVTENYALVSEYGRVEFKFMKYTVFGKPVLGFEAVMPSITPRPWMRTTFDGMQQRTSRKFSSELGKQVMIQANKQKKFVGK